MHPLAPSRVVPLVMLLGVAACSEKSDTALVRPLLRPQPAHRDVTPDGDQTSSMVCKLGPVGTYQYHVSATNVGTAGVFIDATGPNPALTSVNPALSVTWNDVNGNNPKCSGIWWPTLGGGTTQLTISEDLPPGMRVDSVYVVDRHGSLLWRYGPNTTTVHWPDATIPDPTIANKTVDDDHAGYEFRFFDSGDRGEIDFCKFTPTAPGTYNFYYTVSGGGPLMKKVTPAGYFSLAVGYSNQPTCADLIELPPGSSPATVNIVEIPSLGSDLQRWELFDETNLFGPPINVKLGGQGLKSYSYTVSAAYPQRRMLRTWDQPAPLPTFLTANGQSCSPAYWTSREGSGAWGASPWIATGYDPGTNFESIFPISVLELNTPLGVAVQLNSTYNNDMYAVFGNDAVAALLNASHPGIKYGVTKSMVLNWAAWAIGSNTIGVFNGIVEALNQRPCPLP